MLLLATLFAALVGQAQPSSSEPGVAPAEAEGAPACGFAEAHAATGGDLCADDEAAEPAPEPGSRWRSRVQGQGRLSAVEDSVFQNPPESGPTIVYMTAEELGATDIEGPTASSETCEHTREVSRDPATGETEWRVGVTCVGRSGDAANRESLGRDD